MREDADTPATGLALSRAFFEATVDELLAGGHEYLQDRMAAGLVGAGSECLGFDDETSRDHDWGPGYCVWLDPADWREAGTALQERYRAIAARGFAGFPPRDTTSEHMGERRVGVFPVDGFYAWLLGSPGLPSSIDEWRRIPERALAAATNGEVFLDTSGRFTRVRQRLLAYYPKDLRLKLIAHDCAIAAQAGQYNFGRQARRGEKLAALSCLSRFSESATHAVYALSRRYSPFYKWAPRGLDGLGPVGRDVHEALGAVLAAWRAGNVELAERQVERASNTLIEVLHAEGLSQSEDGFLLAQAVEVNSHICDEMLRATDLMAPVTA
ncbi:protein of unknown function [Olsenella sp. KH3B4]|uniref:DUF4037 domain-containing protein n=1 Tax=Olsenella sp. KH3B4 TaxID=1855394 RepID=UPI0008B64C5B|nr:DUF4037 domain-containing protein [Olsenella sp. KH3B4]SET28242.1 protein of unknown function [Olsenella sp. KH3B4]